LIKKFDKDGHSSCAENIFLEAYQLAMPVVFAKYIKRNLH